MEIVHQSKAAAAQRVHTLPIRVYYEDTDAAGVVYYANYLKFAERARTEWLRQTGFNQAALLADRGLVFVVRSVQADYLRGASLDDQLEVLTRIERIGGASVIFSQNVEKGGEVLFQARITIACVDWNRKKSAPIPRDIRAQMEAMP